MPQRGPVAYVKLAWGATIADGAETPRFATEGSESGNLKCGAGCTQALDQIEDIGDPPISLIGGLSK